MSEDWLFGTVTGNDRILKAVNYVQKLYKEILNAFKNDGVARVLSRVDEFGKVETYLLNECEKIVTIISKWP